MGEKYLITGVNSGLGKFLHETIPNSVGLHRDNFDDIEDEEFDIIIHCAFNKELKITNTKKYFDDNIFLIEKLKKLKHNKFIYISTVDLYNRDKNIYSCSKQIAESLLEPNDLILRCSMLVGYTMKGNHIIKLMDNVDKISLSSDSRFNYVSMDDLKNFIIDTQTHSLSGVIDFVSSEDLSLGELKKYLKSDTKLGNYTYIVEDEYINPIFLMGEKYKYKSINNIKKYYKQNGKQFS